MAKRVRYGKAKRTLQNQLNETIERVLPIKVIALKTKLVQRAHEKQMRLEAELAERELKTQRREQQELSTNRDEYGSMCTTSQYSAATLDDIQDHVVSIGRDVACGLNYLHLMRPDRIIHQDISSAIFLLSLLNWMDTEPRCLTMVLQTFYLK
ncbi:hypothetical protein EMCRGX_G005735 [Ephydatia muelleri]